MPFTYFTASSFYAFHFRPCLQLVPAFLIGLALAPISTHAATKTWDGSSSGNWNNSQNWTPSGVPAAGDDLVFPTGVAQLVTTNGIPSLPAFNRITILGANYVIRGASLKLTNGLFCGNSSAANLIEADIEVRGSQSIVVSNQNASLLLRGANLSLGAFGLTLSGLGRLEISSAITGSSGIVKSSPNTVLFHGSSANTYVGGTFVTQGTLKLSKTNATAIAGELVIGDGAGGADADVVQVLRGEQIADTSAVTVNASGWLDCSAIPGGPGGDETIASLALDNGGHVTGPGSGTLVTGGTLTCNGNAKSLIDGGGYFGPGSAPFTINVTGSGEGVNLELQTHTAVLGLTKTGPGRLRIATGSSVAGTFNITQGILEAAHPDALGYPGYSNYVAAGATLLLSGQSVSGEIIQLNGQGVGGTQGALRATGMGSNIVWGGSITLNSDSTVFVSGGGLFNPDTTLTVTGIVSGVGRLIKDGEGILRFSGANANTFSGGTTIKDGYLDLQKTNGVTAIPGNVIIGTGLAGTSPDLHLNAANQIADTADVSITNGMFDLNTFAETIGTLNGGGAVTLGPGSTLTVSPNAATCTYRGVISSPGNLFKYGTGRLILTGTNTYTGSTYIHDGTLQVDGVQRNSDVSVEDAARLTGIGTVGDIATKNGTIAPGSSPGSLTCSNLTFIYSQSVTNEFELNGPAPGTGYDQLNVRGGVSLNSALLRASLGFASALSNQFVIINNDGNDAVTGTYDGLPQNATLTIGAEQFRISYTGGDGNDVVLTQISGAVRSPLFIERASATAVRLLWPTNGTAGFGLQSNTNVNTTNWVAVSPAPVVLGTNNVVTNAVNTSRRFFRLFKP